MNAEPVPSCPPATPQKSIRRRSSARPLPFRLGRYTLLDHIGRGGMADIYLARSQNDLGASRLVVIKEVLAELAESTRFSEMLVAEAKLAARLGHTNVVQVEDLGREHGTLYIAMEYVEGLDLRELLRRCAQQKIPLPVEFSLLVTTEILKGLHYAHRLRDEDGQRIGLVHRDVSPSNVLVSFSGEAKLCDFGIARANDTAAAIAEAAIQGKAGYMSPEHARGDAVDARADIFAAGIILWELLAGRRLYKAKEGERLIDVARRCVVPPLEPLGLPSEEMLHAIVRKALAPDREDRYPSASMMLQDLEAYAAEARMIASPIRFGQWLMAHFGERIVANRRARERALAALDRGPAAKLTPIASPKAVKEVAGATRGSAAARPSTPKPRRRSKQGGSAPRPPQALAPKPHSSKGQGIAGAVLMLAATMVAVLLMLAIGSPPH